MRTHCSHCDRRIWVYPKPQFEAMKDAMVLRNALGPYLYTAGRFAYDEAVASVHPMYYDWDLQEAYDFADRQYLLGEALMAAPVTSSAANYSNGTAGSGCKPGKSLGCYSDHERVEPRTEGGNDMHLTLAKCAARCLPTDKYMAVDSGGPLSGNASQCRCGSKPPSAQHKQPDSACDAGCSGDRSENCGGIWKASVYSLDCPSSHAPSPPPSLSPPADVWVPPGKWLPWNASAEISGGTSGVVLKAQQFALNEIPLFVRAGAVVPTQTMRKEDGPLIWILFPGAAGNGSAYHDDGNTTRYQTSDGVYWAHLTHATAGGTTTIAVTGKHGYQEGQWLQLRRLAGAPTPTKVSCNGKPLAKIAPPTDDEQTSGAGWWIAPMADDSLLVAGGSVMVSLPQSESELSVTVS